MTRHPPTAAEEHETYVKAFLWPACMPSACAAIAGHFWAVLAEAHLKHRHLLASAGSACGSNCSTALSESRACFAGGVTAMSRSSVAHPLAKPAHASGSFPHPTKVARTRAQSVPGRCVGASVRFGRSIAAQPARSELARARGKRRPRGPRP